MVKTSEILLIGGAALLAGMLLSRGKIGQSVGQAAGQTAGGAVSGAVSGAVEGLLVQPYEWARDYPGYIPIIDDVAKNTDKLPWLVAPLPMAFKQLGNPNKWWS